MEFLLTEEHLFYLENPEQYKMIFSLARWLLVTDWQEDSCSLGLNTALTKWMEWCWRLVPELGSAAWQEERRSVKFCGGQGISWGSSKVQLPQCQALLWYLSTSPTACSRINLVSHCWTSEVSEPPCRQTWAWRNTESCSLRQAWFELAHLSQDTRASLPADHTPISLGLPTSGLCQVITESCRLLSILLKIPPYTKISVLSCVTPAVIIPKQTQEQNCAVAGGKILHNPKNPVYFPFHLQKCASN